MNNIEILENLIKRFIRVSEEFTYAEVPVRIDVNDIQAIENLIQENKELKEYKKIAELTKISCCTAQNCEALNNAIKNGLENEKLLQENKELKEENSKLKTCDGILDVFSLGKESSRQRIEFDYIPKSKVKAMLVGITKEHSSILSKDIYSLNDKNIATFQYNAMRKVLEELLEEGE